MSGTLLEVQLFKFGKRGDVLLSRAHHAIMDGYSAVLVVEELVKLLLNMPILNTPITHSQYVSHLKVMQRKSAAEKISLIITSYNQLDLLQSVQSY